MELPRAPHRWRVPPAEARAIQRRLAGAVRRDPPARRPHRLAGVDCAFALGGTRIVAAAVLWEPDGGVEGRVLQQAVVTREVTFPYVPGLLSFREVPAIMAALRRLRQRPDAVLCDGQGYAHPRRLGIACHLGVCCDLPTIGCAKSRLLGEHEDPGPRRGDRTALLDRGERIGTVLRTRSAVRPLYVSLGHRMDLATAEAVVLAAARRYRLPEPVHLADRLSRQHARALDRAGAQAGDR